MLPSLNIVGLVLVLVLDLYCGFELIEFCGHSSLFLVRDDGINGPLSLLLCGMTLERLFLLYYCFAVTVKIEKSTA